MFVFFDIGIVPAGLGNIVGGALFCGMYYWWMFVFREPPIPVDGVYYDAQGPLLPVQSTLRGLESKDAEQQIEGSVLERQSTR